MIKILFLLLFAGVWSWNQPVSLPTVPQTIVPNLQAPALTLPKGTSIAPLCDPSLNIPCLQQWAHQARPLAVTAPGASLPIMKYFLPSLLIRNSLPTNTKMDGWELFTPSFSGSRRSSSRRRTKYYRKKSDSSKIRRVIEEEGKVKEIKAADAINVDADTVEAIDSEALKKKVGSDLLPPSIRDTKERGEARNTLNPPLKKDEKRGRTTERGVLEQEKDIEDKKEIVGRGQAKGIVETETSSPTSPTGATADRGVRREVTPPQSPADGATREAKRKAEREEAKRKAEREEAKRKVEREEAKRKAEREEAKRKVEREEAKRKVEREEAKRKAEREEAERKAEREEAKRKAEREEAKRKVEREEAKRKVEREEAKRKVEREEAKRKAEREEAKRKAEREEAKRKVEREEAKRKVEREEAKRKVEREEAKRKVEREEAKRKVEREEAKRKVEREEAKRKVEREEAKRKVEREEVEREEAEREESSIRPESAVVEEGFPEVVITKPIVAIRGKVDTPTKELSGCVEVENDSMDDLEAKAVCEDCYQGNPHLRGILQKTGALEKVVTFFKSVARGGMEDRSGYSERIGGKLAGTQICSPGEALKLIISNFNTNEGCKPMKFDKFVKKTYCRSCNEQGIPPEIILSMTTIESAGKCDARGDDDGSMGLLQVNSRDHKCEGYTAGTKKNKECLMNPDTNVRHGMSLLKKGYNAVNPKKSWKKPCSRWSQLGFKERDRLRRAVAAYNGNGGGWINRAVQSIEGNVDDSTGKAIGRNPYEDTMKDLNKKHLGSSLAGRARKSNASWEELRIYFIMEKLLPGNVEQRNNAGEIIRGKTGRQDKNTLSNLAHTEAVLGRENEKGRILPGIVDYWEEYLKTHKPKTCSK